MQKSQFRLHLGREVAADCTVTALLALFYALTWRRGTAHETVPWTALLALVAVLPTAGRRRWPAAALAVSTVASAILIANSVNPLPALPRPSACT